MNAICKCQNGHTFSNRVVEDSPEISYFEMELTECPECGTEEFEVIDTETEHFDDDVI